VGAGGGSCPPWRYFCPPWTTFAPFRLLSWAIFGTLRRRFYFADFGSKTLWVRWRSFLFFFFLENAEFWAKKTPQIRWWPFFLFYLFFFENAGFWDKKQSNFSEEPYFAFQALALLVLPPLSWNSSRATALLLFLNTTFKWILTFVFARITKSQ